MVNFLPRKTSGENWNIWDYDDDFGSEIFDWNWPRAKQLLRGTIKVDIQEKPDKYVIEAEVPGYEKNDICVDIDNGYLTIAVSREEKREEEKKDYVHRERHVSSVSRTLFFDDAKNEAVKAKLEKGVLTIEVPRQEELSESKRSIEIE